MVLLIDNYDSFTYNLYQYVAEFCKVKVYRNDKITIEDIYKLNPQAIIISPGPSIPENAGVSIPVVKEFKNKLPILGICLGHQAIAAAFGTKIVRAPVPVHGKVSYIYHSQNPIFEGINNPFEATRYHSLVVDIDSLSSSLKVIAWTQDKLIMGIQYEDKPVYGLQFHPESIFTTFGKRIIKNFLKIGGVIYG
ncbi:MULTISPECIES: anthranilate synthase component II [Dictyoglomus]|jgi:anthranilate synthase/aminodeoxychorismate synthase-like glutamine amidotransferase|uniref:Glutamine amidotransferase of anthranilate synthase n=1 Tax=Dictyoglomus turgidum (strain DSM 6724 / Z-1310) TaxID=515635 RepID=B8DZP3_DICTD|nr:MULTISPECIES: aminodeoxychorismate/anthranilate synthase component II [Dictyoglomus]ACK41976.1 glutamine amidotransferase of anthranilate synthase [Dictyoglomus turgidum DSM 6724]PNV79280.1 MAG: type 1 glutamine amidotransferase [Dictyoglomus turgidum]HBU31464.1 aminodeoxychorismate/anthranilate synthase component II [Dictyoglomus sp.]